MGTRETDQPSLWIATSDLPASPGHPFYTRLNAVLDAHGFDRFAEELRSQYSMGYVSTNTARDGRWRRLDVKVSRPVDASGRRTSRDLRVQVRKGYFAPFVKP